MCEGQFAHNNPAFIFHHQGVDHRDPEIVDIKKPPVFFWAAMSSMASHCLGYVCNPLPMVIIELVAAQHDPSLQLWHDQY